MGAVTRTASRKRRQKRVRRFVKGKPDRPRLCVFRSSRHIYAQIIDDVGSMTLVEASSLSKALKETIGKDGGNKKGAGLVGAEIAKRAIEKGIRTVVFDRNGFLYHGRVRALSEAARQNGLDF